ncbi:MAG TPA: hypothetical protein VNY52_09855 [Solirubrobacteraceae bacterium]|jgi:hypothetical protein|nr:hypothetical protein [Solirubrobacteraceae bacterium]
MKVASRARSLRAKPGLCSVLLAGLIVAYCSCLALLPLAARAAVSARSPRASSSVGAGGGSGGSRVNGSGVGVAGVGGSGVGVAGVNGSGVGAAGVGGSGVGGSPGTGSTLEAAASRAGSTGRKVAMSLIGLAFAIAGIVLAFRRDFKEAAGVFAVGIVAVLLATPAGINLLQDTVNSLFGA